MKIALLGSAASVHRAPFQDSRYEAFVQGRLPDAARAHGLVPGDWDIWGCSPGCWAVIPRATRWFEVHRWEPEQPWFSLEYRTFLQRFRGPVYTGAPISDFPTHVVYPIDRMEAKYGSYFFTSSLALMLAMAIDTIEQIRRARWSHQMAKDDQQQLDAGVPNLGHEQRVHHVLPDGVDQAELEKSSDQDVIGMWGVDMAAHEEYAYQRPGCQFFILEALRRGIKFFLPPESDLMRPMPVYGISEWDHNYIKLTQRARELNARKGQLQGQIQQADEQIKGLAGELHALQAFVNTWTSPYGLPHGVTLECLDGMLGGGVTHLDARPLESRSAAMQALAAPARVPDDMVRAAQLGRELSAALGAHAVSTDASPIEALRRILGERASAIKMAEDRWQQILELSKPKPEKAAKRRR